MGHYRGIRGDQRNKLPIFPEEGQVLRLPQHHLHSDHSGLHVRLDLLKKEEPSVEGPSRLLYCSDYRHRLQHVLQGLHDGDLLMDE